MLLKKKCFFCVSKKDPDYTDANSLRKFLSDRSKINPRVRTGLCGLHQRRLTQAIKRARHLSLLPFIQAI